MSENKFKDSQGRWLTASLFYEKSYSDKAIYTMKPEDSNGLPSFRRMYLEIGDPTEYRQANALLGGWEHWQALCSSKWFNEYMDPIREELEVKLRSEGILATYEIMAKGDKSALPAAKIFMEGLFKEKRGKGRPSNEEIENEARKKAEIRRRLKEHAERIGIGIAVDNDKG